MRPFDPAPQPIDLLSNRDRRLDEISFDLRRKVATHAEENLYRNRGRTWVLRGKEKK
jgi:hypothetical protein